MASNVEEVKKQRTLAKASVTRQITRLSSLLEQQARCSTIKKELSDLRKKEDTATVLNDELLTLLPTPEHGKLMTWIDEVRHAVKEIASEVSQYLESRVGEEDSEVDIDVGTKADLVKDVSTRQTGEVDNESRVSIVTKSSKKTSSSKASKASEIRMKAQLALLKAKQLEAESKKQHMEDMQRLEAQRCAEEAKRRREIQRAKDEADLLNLQPQLFADMEDECRDAGSRVEVPELSRPIELGGIVDWLGKCPEFVPRDRDSWVSQQSNLDRDIRDRQTLKEISRGDGITKQPPAECMRNDNAIDLHQACQKNVPTQTSSYDISRQLGSIKVPQFSGDKGQYEHWKPLIRLD
jgi:hypothetical protein